MRSLIVKILTGIYRYLVSPFIHLLAGAPNGCRFTPTCSEYASEAMQTHGFLKGGMYTFKRISRCHPFARAGYDPVPRAIETHQYSAQGR